MSDIVKETVENDDIYIIDPSLTSPQPPDEFLDRYGHMLDTIALVAKGRKGYTYYPSNNAPKHQDLSVFFHSFCTIADNMGIKVDAFSYIHRDEFLSQNADFRVNTSSGPSVDLYACPSQPYLSQYNAAIALEIINYPINQLILQDLMFPNLKTCFCDRCRRVFAQRWNIERDFSFDYLKNRDIYSNWINYRTNLINQTLREITDQVKAIKNIDVGITLKADSETNFLDGIKERFGQDINNLLKITNNLLIHVNPWTKLPKSTDEVRFNEILTALSRIPDFVNSGINCGLLFWNITSLDELRIAQKLKDELNLKEIYVQSELPSDYTKVRQINLGF